MIELTGFSGGSPIGFMAALGLMRVLAEDRRLDVGLGWNGMCPFIEGMDSTDALINQLFSNMKGRAEAPEWNWHETGRKVTPGEFVQACAGMVGDNRALSFMAGFGTDAVVNKDGFIGTTRLNLTSGRQRFINDLRSIARVLVDVEEETARKILKSALLGGEYEDQSAFGWDPAAIRTHAHEAIAPTLSPPPGKKGLVWLAAESLALHPVLPSRGWVMTTGCERLTANGSFNYFWPLWGDTPLGLGELRLVRALSFEALTKRPGITQVWASEFGKSGKYGVLKPGARVR